MRFDRTPTYPRDVGNRSSRPDASGPFGRSSSTGSIPPPPSLDAVVVDLDSFRIGNDPVLVVDPDSMLVLDANERARELFGYAHPPRADETIDRLVGEPAPFDAEALRTEIVRATRLGFHRFSWRTLDVDRRPIFLELTIRLARIGGERRFLVVAQDQTEKIALLEALERTTAVLRNAVSRSPVAIVLFDALDARIRLTNRAAEVLRADSTRYSQNAIEAFRFTERDGRALAPEAHPFRRVLEGGESIENAQLTAVADGRRRAVLVHAAPILSSHGAILSGVAIFPDVTDITRAEAALLERDNFLRRFYEQTREVIFGVDAEGRLISVSPSVREVLGHAPAELVGLRIGGGVVVDPTETPRLVRDVARVITGEYLDSTDYLFRTNDARTRVGEVTGSQIEDRDGKPTAIFVMRDVTERRVADEQRSLLETALRKRQRLETVGSLASGVAHEINNPLTGILNLAEMLELGIVASGDVAKTGTRIRALCERMATIVSELMALARTEPDDVVSVDVNSLVQSALDLIRAQLRRTRIETKVDAQSGLPKIRGRTQPLVQAVVNILGNACEALAELGPEEIRNIGISVRCLPIDGRDTIRISIEDSGRGIEESLKNSIFEPFVTTKEQSAGAGLGLWVSRSIATEHGGRLWYEDAKPRGSRFHLDLPVDDTTRPTDPPESRA